MDKKSILIFGVGPLQKSIIEQCKSMGLFTVGIDPSSNASCKDIVNVFVVVGGQDFDKTLEIARKYKISGIITAATDKPLVMMARIAEILHLPFYTVSTARCSTDKFLMKECFIKGKIPCAKGKLIRSPEEIEGFHFPLILKPRDNSGSKGVIFCNNITEINIAFKESVQFTKMDTILVEEYIEGQEYSIESLHFDGKSHILQYTEKITTPLPYNVELGHLQPANLTQSVKDEINVIISKIAESLGFENCASHTELKVNERGIFVIETSPRLGGDYITSHLVPLSTGVNMENFLINVSLGQKATYTSNNKASLVHYFNFPLEKKVNQFITQDEIQNLFPAVALFYLNLKKGDIIKKITNSHNRYGEFILSGDNIKDLKITRDKITQYVESIIFT